jgi:hypothetical protein
MAFDLVAVFLAQPLLQELQPRLFELLNLSATQAAKMAVVGMAVNMLVMPVAVAEIHFPDETAFDEQG